MKFKRLLVDNIRSYSNLDISFDSGVTVISGVNGSGKSSLLESCFTGLFGSRTLSKDFVLSDMIRKGSKKASISLEFEQNGRDYAIEQGYRNDPEKGRASNMRSVLKVDGDVFIDQASQTYDAIRSLLNMDEEAYRNCVYIRQGEIDILINARPKDRQRMIDDLLQIGKLEEYRERASSARVGVGRHQRDVGSRIKDVKAQIEAIESSEPIKKLEDLRTRSGQVQSKLEQRILLRDTARSRIEETKARVSEHSQLLARKDSINSEVSDFNKRKSEAFDQIKASRSQISSKKGSFKALEEKNSSLRAKLGMGYDDIDKAVEELEVEEKRAADGCNSLYNRLMLIEKDESQKKQSIKDIEDQISQVQKNIQDLRSGIDSKKADIKSHSLSIEKLEQQKREAENRVEELGFTLDKLENVDDIMDLLTDRQQNLHGREREISTLLSEIEKRMKKNKELLSKGKCPTCGQDLKDSHIHRDVGSDETDKRSHLKELEDIKKDQQEIQAKLERVKSLKKLAKEITDFDNKVQLVRNAVNSLDELIKDHMSRIDSEESRIKELKTRKDELRRSAGDINKNASFIKAG